MTEVVSSITTVFTSLTSWFTTTLGTVTDVFYSETEGLTFIGTLAVISVAIGVATMVIAMIRSLLKLRG